MGETNKKEKRWLYRVLPVVLVVAGVLCLIYYFGFAKRSEVQESGTVSQPTVISAAESEPETASSTAEASSDPTADYPEGKLFITVERSQYQSGGMTLTVPKLGLTEIPVLPDVDDETLKSGVGLYEYAQMPGTGNRNVSIAGHRDIYGEEFYDIDKLAEGDEFYLTYEGKRYTYVYKDTKIVEADDWSPIYIQGFSCLTLTSCTPIGVASHRIIVRAELNSIEEI